MQKIDQDLRAITSELAKNPESERLKNTKAALFNNKALLLGQSGKHNDAIRLLNQALALSSLTEENILSITSNKASILHKASRFNDSIECAQQVLELDVNNEKAIEILVLNYSSQASLENEKGNNNEALIKQDKAIELKPEDSVLLYNKANILNELGKYDDALIYIDKSLQIDPSLTIAKTLKAFIFHKKSSNEGDRKNYEEAISWIDKAIEVNPSEIAFFINKSNFLFKLKQYDKCLETATKALELQPTNADALSIKNIACKYLK